jgi:uncharacterized ion transporter superfamily protein YfcC
LKEAASGRRFRVPHTWALLFGLVVVAALSTHLIPAGEYSRTDVGGRSVVDPDSYHAVEPQAAGVAETLLAFPRGLIETAAIVFYIFIIGGAFGVIDRTGAIGGGIEAVAHACGGRGELVIVALMLLFALAGGTMGMAEETLPFLPGLVLLARRLGYDEVTGGAIALVGAGAGFAGAFLNPFTVGVAQGIAGLPLFSGLGYRLVVWAVMTALAIFWVMRYARGVRDHTVVHEAPAASGASLSPRQWMVLAVVLLALIAVAVGALEWQWGLLELSGLFVAVAVVAGLAGGLGGNGTGEAFVAGATSLAGGALVVGLARGVLVILDGARVIDTILHGLAGLVAGLPAWASVSGIFAVQVGLNYLVPSGSGQAALSIPVLAPLADLVGVTRQTTVLAYQLGDGISNVFTPTQGYFMAGLALINVPWIRWAKFMWPLQLLWLGAGLVLLLIAHAIGW